MSIQILNTTSQLSGKTLLITDGDETITGAKSFNLSPSAPFAVTASSGLAINLDADMVDDVHWSEWTAWTPAWSNIALGNGTSTGYFAQCGKLVMFTANLTFGTTTTVVTPASFISLNYPVAPHVISSIISIGYCTNVGIASYPAYSHLASGTLSNVYYHNPVTGLLTLVTGTAPFTLGNTDAIYLRGFYFTP